MSEQKTLPPAILLHIAQELTIPLKSVVAVVELLNEGGTVPFIARYRKEATSNLNEVSIAAIEERSDYFSELEDRRKTVLASIQECGKLTTELRAQIESVVDKSVLEDLYLPYKPKRRTKAIIAREKGLTPLAEYLWAQQQGERDINTFARTFVDADLGVASVEEALEGARYIVAEQISEIAEYRKSLRQLMLSDGLVVSRLVEDAQDPEGKFKMYADYSEPAAKIPSHRMLAIRRGSNENILYFQIELDSAKALTYLKRKVLQASGDWIPQLELAVEDAWKRLLNLSIQTEVRLELKERSDAEAIRVFRENLNNLLLTPPAGRINVLGLDPGLRTGCKIAAVDDTGKFLDHGVIYPLAPKNDNVGAARALLQLIRKHDIRAIAIGNGTGSREAAAFIQDFIKEERLSGTFSVVVSESGASVYSASALARQEFPELDLTIRSAISIARRLQDPLAELVKVDPKSIGIGQYQHDVDQRKLNDALETTIVSCVNKVGVDLNTASFALLRHVAGLNDRTAQNIVEFRNDNGRFTSRLQLRSVRGIGPKSFEQAAGFLRIRDGANPLDMTGVHPESYVVVDRIAASLAVTITQLIAQPSLLEPVRLEQFQTEHTGAYTLHDIREELRKPGRDPRSEFVVPQFQSDIKKISDLTPGMILEGAVTNVTNFGAFVDLGVHQDGLIHVSEISHRFIKNPAEAVKVGQVVRVKVLSVDSNAKRIALSVKALAQSEVPRVRNVPQSEAKTSHEPQAPCLQDQISALSSRFRSR